MVDFSDEASEDLDYEEYELTKEQRASLRSIQETANKGYRELSVLRKHLNYLEQLIAEVQRILREEERMGYDNDTLKHDYQKILRLEKRLNSELDRLDDGF